MDLDPAAFPAHVLVELEAAFPPLLALALFVTNCSEALIAALGVRAFSDAPHRLDTLKRMLVFVLMAGIAAPFLSSFLDAGRSRSSRGRTTGWCGGPGSSRTSWPSSPWSPPS